MINFAAFVDDVLLLIPRCFCPLALLGVVQKLQLPVKRLLPCDEDLMCSSHGTNGICPPPPAVAFPVCSQREGTRHAFIHRFLEVLVSVS